MDAPLALFLTHFSAEPPPPPPMELDEFPVEMPEAEPAVSLPTAEYEAQLEAAAEAARTEAQQRHEAEMAALIAEHEVATADAVAAARAEWIEAEREGLTKALDGVMGDLRTALAEGIANVLRPLLADAFIARTKTEVTDALDRLLADPTQPVLAVRCPEDLAAALRADRPDASIEWIASDGIEVSITADATRIETKLAAVLAELETTET